MPSYKVTTCSSSRERRQRGFIRKDVRPESDTNVLPLMPEHKTYKKPAPATPGGSTSHSSSPQQAKDRQPSSKDVTASAKRPTTSLTPDSNFETPSGHRTSNPYYSSQSLRTYDSYSQPSLEQLVAMDAYQPGSGQLTTVGSITDSDSSVQIITEQPDVEVSPRPRWSPHRRGPNTQRADQDSSMQSSLAQPKAGSDNTASGVPQRISINSLPRRHRKMSTIQPSSIAESSQRSQCLSKRPPENPMPPIMDAMAGDDKPGHKSARSLQPRVAGQINTASLKVQSPRQQNFPSNMQVTATSHSKQSESRSAKQHLAPHLMHVPNASSACDRVTDRAKPSPKNPHYEVQVDIPPHKQTLTSKTPKEVGEKYSPGPHSNLPAKPPKKDQNGELPAQKSSLDVHTLQAELESISKATAKADGAIRTVSGTQSLQDSAPSTVDNRVLRPANKDGGSHLQILDDLVVPIQDTSRLSGSIPMSGTVLQSEDEDVKQTWATCRGPYRSASQLSKEIKPPLVTDARHANSNQPCELPNTESSSTDLPDLWTSKSKGKGKEKEVSGRENQDGAFQLAFSAENWETRPSFDLASDQKLAGVKAWAIDLAFDEGTKPAVLDTGHPDFLTGIGLVHGDTELEAAIDANLHNTERSNTAVSLLKRNQTAQRAIEERLSIQKMAGEFPQSSMADMSKEERRAKRLALMEDIQRRKQEPKMPSEHKPEANIYMRSVEMKDVPPITEIYNYYIEHSVATPEIETYDAQYWQRTITECEQDKYPFVVAILTRQKFKQRAQTQPLKTEPVVGFAWAVNYGSGNNAYRYTAELDICVHPEHLHKGIGKTLLDRMMFAMSPTYSFSWKDPVPFIESKGSNLCTGRGRETKIVTAAILFTQADEKDLEWKRRWLVRYGFQVSGTVLNIAYKFGRPLGICHMYHDTGRNISLVKV